MSLAQHVTQSEGFDYAGGVADGRSSNGGDETTRLLGTDHPGTGKPKWRSMNFGVATRAEQEDQIPAYEVSVARRGGK